jgi:uncharacterized protein HemX
VAEESIEKQVVENIIPPQQSPRTQGLWIGIIIFLIIIVLAGAGFYLWQQLRSQSDTLDKEDQRSLEISKQISGFQSQLSAIQSQLATATSSLANTNAQFDRKLADLGQAQDNKLQAVHQELGSTLIQLQRQWGKTRGDWLLADADYLLTVAGQRLQLIGDVQTAREALEAADQRLRESGDAGAFKIREQIAKELEMLRAIPNLDIVGLYAKLQTLSTQVDKLPLFLPYQGKPVVSAQQHDQHPTSSLTEYPLLDAALKQMDGYVTVRHTQQPIKAILTTEQVQFIRQQLSLKVEMIKLALVQKNQALYSTSLQDSLNWLTQNFNQNAQTKNFTHQLEELNQIQLNAQLPDISLSLKMLRDIAKLRLETDKALPTETSEPVKPAESSASSTEPTKTETSTPSVESAAQSQATATPSASESATDSAPVTVPTTPEH